MDFVLVNGDAYVDHPSSGAGLLFRVCFRGRGLPGGRSFQPDFTTRESMKGGSGRPQRWFSSAAAMWDTVAGGALFGGKDPAAPRPNYTPAVRQASGSDRAPPFANAAGKAGFTRISWSSWEG